MSRIYENCKEAIDEIERDIAEMGILNKTKSMQNKIIEGNEDYDALEVQNYSFCILDSSDKDDIVENLEWCEAEFKERTVTVHVNPGAAWKLRKEVWSEFLVDGKFDYTYNERINQNDQLWKVIKELTDNPGSRQCVIDIHQAYDINSMRNKRIPCSLSYQLMIRKGKLDIIYNMRSSDFDTHFKNDIWEACELRNFIATHIGIESGKFFMNIGSLHRYKNYTKHVF